MVCRVGTWDCGNRAVKSCFVVEMAFEPFEVVLGDNSEGMREKDLCFQECVDEGRWGAESSATFPLQKALSVVVLWPGVERRKPGSTLQKKNSLCAPN